MTNQYVPDLAQLGPGDIARSQDVNDRYENTVTGFDRLPTPKNGEQGFAAPVPVGAPVNSDHAATKDFVETGVTSQVVIAQGHANDANASKIAAANSETAAAASESVALSQSGIATTKANEALASKIAAAASESAALSSQNAAATSESNASTSESAAQLSETNSGVSETNASNSAADALSYKNAATSSASTASTQAGIATTKANEASASETNAATSETNAAASEANAATSATNAAASAASIVGDASAAAASEANAAASETAASASETNAASSETSAATSEANAAASFDSFDDRYLGAKASDPTLDNDGDALITGALHFNTTSGDMKVYNGIAWLNAYSSITGQTLDQVTTTGNTTTNAVTVGNLTSTGIDDNATSTAITIDASGDFKVGSGSKTYTVGSGTYELDIAGGLNLSSGRDNGADMTFEVSNSLGMRIDASGNLTATGNVTAYSDERLKSDIETLDGSKVYSMRGVSFTKDGEASSGVIAQELQEVAPELVHKGEKYLSVAYGNLVGYLIEAVKELKAEIEELKEAK